MTLEPIPGHGPIVVGKAEAAFRVVIDLRDVDHSALQALRLLLIGDVLRRVVEDLQGRRTLLTLLQRESEAAAALALAAKALAIRDPSFLTSSPTEAVAFLGGPAHVAFEPEGPTLARPDRPRASRVLRVGTATVPQHLGGAQFDASLPFDHQPLALRLALLRFPYSSPAGLSRPRLHRAGETLHRWQFKVAAWKDIPSPSGLPGVVDAMRAAFAGDLDTCTVLRLLHRLEIDPRLDSGTKFETFVLLDRVLALDLCRLVGMPRGWGAHW